jgi:hypothetical protein
LSVVFAFVFAPAGAVLGHLAVSQIKHRPQPGHRRVVLEITLSYVFIVLAAVALIVWLLLDAGAGGQSGTTTVAPAPVPAPSVSSTVITPPPQGRPRVSVANLRVGDCVEIQKTNQIRREPLPTRCAFSEPAVGVRDGVFQVRQLVPNANHCPAGEHLSNEQGTIFACFVKYGQ